MSLQGVSPETEICLALLGRQKWINPFYLAGGTGVSLQLGHRLSFDLDFFTPKDFSTRTLRNNLGRIGKFQLDQQSPNTLLGTLADTKVSFFTYKYPLLYPTQSFLGAGVADLKDIGCMKLDAIGSRGSKK